MHSIALYFEVVAVATSSSLERAQDFRKSLKLASTVKFYGSYQDLLNDADVGKDSFRIIRSRLQNRYRSTKTENGI